MAIDNLSGLLRMFKRQKLLIIGAGCSQNYTQGTSNIDGLVSPLDSNFFKMAKKVLLRANLEPSLTMQIEEWCTIYIDSMAMTHLIFRIGLILHELRSF